jgi:aspartate beta-hydroxylase
MARIVQSAICHLQQGVARQRPTLFFVPSLRATPVWSLADLPDAHQRALRALQSSAGDLLAEYDALQAEVPSDYSTSDPTRHDGEHKLHDGSWDWHSYVKKGARQAAFAAHCPTTVSLLEDVPGLMTDFPFGFAFFSTLHPQTKIAPHTAPCNLRVRCHLPLRVPRPSDASATCGMELAGRSLEWREGELLLFDDSYEHAVWNDTGEPRVLLLLDLWHPELSEAERTAMSDLFRRAQDERQGRGDA